MMCRLKARLLCGLSMKILRNLVLVMVFLPGCAQLSLSAQAAQQGLIYFYLNITQYQIISRFSVFSYRLEKKSKRTCICIGGVKASFEFPSHNEYTRAFFIYFRSLQTFENAKICPSSCVCFFLGWRCSPLPVRDDPSAAPSSGQPDHHRQPGHRTRSSSRYNRILGQPSV